tara:strand:+ start:236 stop:361 length:126 start_codon:yes stop_codon:yes gene_type:complete
MINKQGSIDDIKNAGLHSSHFHLAGTGVLFPKNIHGPALLN